MPMIKGHGHAVPLPLSLLIRDKTLLIRQKTFMLNWHQKQYLLVLNTMGMLSHLGFFFHYFSKKGNPGWPLINAGRMDIRIVFRGILSFEDDTHHKQNGDLWVEGTYQITHYKSNFAVSSAEGLCSLGIVPEVWRVHSWCSVAPTSVVGGLGENALSANSVHIHYSVR